MGCRFSTMYGVWNTHPTIGVSCQRQPWKTLHSGLKRRHTLQIPDMILSHSLHVSRHMHGSVAGRVSELYFAYSEH